MHGIRALPVGTAHWHLVWCHLPRRLGLHLRLIRCALRRLLLHRWRLVWCMALAVRLALASGRVAAGTGRVWPVNAAAHAATHAAAKLQFTHVPHHCGGIECLLWHRKERQTDRE